MSAARAPRVVPCPACGKPAAFDASNPWRPFCSERCRLVDLGAWATGSYRIPAAPGGEGAEAPGDEAGEAPGEGEERSS